MKTETRAITLSPKIFILIFILSIVTYITIKSINKYKELKNYIETSEVFYEKVIKEKKKKEPPELQVVEKFSGENLPEGSHNQKFETVALREGNGKWGFWHIFKRHSPSNYIKDKIVPKNTTLFLRPERGYIQGQIRKFLQSKNITKLECNHNGYSIYESTIKVDNQINRTYRMVIENKTNNIVTFYPTEDIPFKLLTNKDEYLIYRILLYGK